MFRNRQMVRSARQVRSDGPPPAKEDAGQHEQIQDNVEPADRISFASAVQQVEDDNVPASSAPSNTATGGVSAQSMEPSVFAAPGGAETAPLEVAEDLVPASKLYADLVSKAQSVFEAAQNSAPLEYTSVFGALKDCLNSLRSSDDLLTESIRHRLAEHTLPGRAANVAVLSLRLGLQLKFDERQNLALGLCSLMHDLGMTTVPEEILNSRKLTPEQLGVLRRHPLESKAMVESFGDQFAWIGEVVVQVHERQDGSGYPEGLSGDDIHEFARIIGLADTYAAMSHPRPDREAPITYNALTEIIDVRNTLFDPALVKSLINIVSIFPLGSLVQLNNGTVGRVIGANRLQPARPLIEVLLDSQGRLLKVPHTVDLAEEPMLHISDPAISENRLTERSGRR